MVMSDLNRPDLNSLSPISISLEAAQVSFGEDIILDQITASFHKAEITAILGPNGAGKSTFLSALAGLHPLSAGMRLMKDHQGQDAPITRLGYVLQKPVMFRRSVRDNIAIAQKAAGFDAAAHSEDRDQMLRLMGLDHLSHKSALQLSQGERQRLAVARVLLMRPGLLMLDEAGNSLDRDTTTILEREVRRYADAGMPVLWVTHNLDQARRIADRIIVMEGGCIITDTAAQDYFEKTL